LPIKPKKIGYSLKSQVLIKSEKKETNKIENSSQNVRNTSEMSKPSDLLTRKNGSEKVSDLNINIEFLTNYKLKIIIS